MFLSQYSNVYDTPVSRPKMLANARLLTKKKMLCF